MKYHRFLLFFAVLFFAPIASQSQTVSDALRYSRWTYGGSARFAATGGSLTAFGGDYSAIISNPASLGAFRRGEFTFTSGFRYTGLESNVVREATAFSDERLTANVNQMALVFVDARNEGDLRALNFSVGFNRLADFSRRYNFFSQSEGSIGNYFVEQAEGITDPNQLNNFGTGLAWDTYLMDFPIAGEPDTTTYVNLLGRGGATNKFQTVEERGFMGEFNIALGANVNHQLYLGASIGIPMVRFTQNKSYEERDEATGESVVYQEDLTTEGAGLNLRLGAIYRFSQAFRMGLALHTPSWLFQSDEFTTGMATVIDLQGSGFLEAYESLSPVGEFRYRQRTPMRLVANAGWMFEKKGFLSAELEWVDYRRNSFNFNSGDALAADLLYENQLNNDIEAFFQSTVNLKLGGELVMADYYRLRAGYNFFGAPSPDDPGALQQVSLGLGYRGESFFADLAYINQFGESYYQPYAGSASNESPLIRNNLSAHRVLLTFGFKFGY